jgi:hypothetical protein
MTDWPRAKRRSIVFDGSHIGALPYGSEYHRVYEACHDFLLHPL